MRVSILSFFIISILSEKNKFVFIKFIQECRFQVNMTKGNKKGFYYDPPPICSREDK